MSSYGAPREHRSPGRRELQAPPLIRWSDRAAKARTAADHDCGTVSTLTLRPGMDLVLSDLRTGADETFVHEEAEDVFGIGFHLKGGSLFEFEEDRFATQALDSWMASAPRGAVSRFRLPAGGFRTVSLRFTPEAAVELIGCDCPAGTHLIEMARAATDRVIVESGGKFAAATATSVGAMLDTAFAGSARRLHLESCALGLLAAQISASIVNAVPVDASITALDRKRLFRARDHLDAHIVDPPSILELARVCGLNDFKLKRDFKRLFGVTVFGYVRERRLEQAAAHLRQGLSVQQAALDVGYACPSRFAQAFRRRYGAPPSDIGRRSLM